MEHKTYCGLDCGNCDLKTVCAGCVASGGKPFGGACVAAEYIKAHGREAYAAFKAELLSEINELLRANGIPEAAALWELSGKYVNLAYPLPSGESIRFLDDRKIYLGAQIEREGEPRCCGVIADTEFILICSYLEKGADPELILYRKRGPAV